MQSGGQESETQGANLSNLSHCTIGRSGKGRLKRVSMHTSLLKDLSPRGFQWKIIVHITRIWEHRDQETQQNLVLGFVAVDQEVPSRHFRHLIHPLSLIDEIRAINSSYSSYFL
ncbi:unnamed protein product [Alopecurus aequalis]